MMYTIGFAGNFSKQLLVALSLLLSGCASVSKDLESINDYNLLREIYLDSSLPVVYGLPQNLPTNTLRFYIEGDGRAWLSKYRPSYDPTPTNSLVLKLMQIDATPAIYLARPCQYVQSGNCQQYYWTEGRHAALLVDAMNETISAIKKRYEATDIELIGHSGGGTMAVLIAARRSDVKRIITVAANLDVAFFTKYHKVTPMTGSLNPMSVVDKVKYTPQLHLAGGKDKAIPPMLVKRYIKKGKNPCMHYKEYPLNGHHKGWLTIWPQVLNDKFSCEE